MLLSLGRRAALPGLRHAVCGAGVVGARHASNGPEAPWDLLAAVCLERPPRLTPALVPIQQRTVDILEMKELEESLLSDHELRHRYEDLYKFVVSKGFRIRFNMCVTLKLSSLW